MSGQADSAWAPLCLVTPAEGGWSLSWRGESFNAILTSFCREVRWRRGVHWDGDGWYIPAEHEATLRSWLTRRFGRHGVEWLGAEEDGGPEHDHQVPGVSAHEAARAEAAKKMYLLPDAPDFLVTAAFRALALRLHPDQGGNDQTMIALTAARDMLLKKPP